MQAKNTSIKVISFDLDNTLYDNQPVLQNAEEHMHNYLQQQFTLQKLPVDTQQYLQIKQQIQKQSPIRNENVSLLRQAALKKICQPLKDSTKVANQAFAIFIQQRNKIVIIPAIEKLLKQLSQQYILVSITNGNFDISQSNIATFFNAHYSPCKGFRAKPHPQMLQQVINDYSIQAAELLHVGDCLQSDAQAAKNAQVNFVHFSPFADGCSIEHASKELRNFLSIEEN